ncbi:hypothetical protein PAPYR_2181 [Paratrimastix pyriformis]|uniref:EF-hand domain-containing protein n=1 Tax=Paratrimastix pyriformis TaxID=342808 RepID=A0ABQ8UV13_9EUKA|nr:hypothetical protein PAPYR_2181 [Paratrimastix pyriformis]
MSLEIVTFTCVALLILCVRSYQHLFEMGHGSLAELTRNCRHAGRAATVERAFSFFECFVRLPLADLNEETSTPEADGLDEVEILTRNVFSSLDPENRGYVDVGQLKSLLDEMCIQKTQHTDSILSSEPTGSDELNELIKQLDHDGNGQVSFDEFLEYAKIHLSRDRTPSSPLPPPGPSTPPPPGESPLVQPSPGRRLLTYIPPSPQKSPAPKSFPTPILRHVRTPASPGSPAIASTPVGSPTPAGPGGDVGTGIYDSWGSPVVPLTTGSHAAARVPSRLAKTITAESPITLVSPTATPFTERSSFLQTPADEKPSMLGASMLGGAPLDLTGTGVLGLSTAAPSGGEQAAQLDDLRAANESLARDNTLLKKQCDELRALCQSLEDDNQAHYLKVAELDRQVDSPFCITPGTITNLGAQREDLQQLSVYRQQCDELNVQTDELRQFVRAAHEAQAALEHDLLCARDESAHLSRTLNEREISLQKAEAQAERLQADVQRLEASATSFSQGDARLREDENQRLTEQLAMQQHLELILREMETSRALARNGESGRALLDDATQAFATFSESSPPQSSPSPPPTHLTIRHSSSPPRLQGSLLCEIVEETLHRASPNLGGPGFPGAPGLLPVMPPTPPKPLAPGAARLAAAPGPSPLRNRLEAVRMRVGGGGSPARPATLLIETPAQAAEGGEAAGGSPRPRHTLSTDALVPPAEEAAEDLSAFQNPPPPAHAPASQPPTPARAESGAEAGTGLAIPAEKQQQQQQEQPPAQQQQQQQQQGEDAREGEPKPTAEPEQDRAGPPEVQSGGSQQQQQQQQQHQVPSAEPAGQAADGAEAPQQPPPSATEQQQQQQTSAHPLAASPHLTPPEPSPAVATHTSTPELPADVIAPAAAAAPVAASPSEQQQQQQQQPPTSPALTPLSTQLPSLQRHHPHTPAPAGRAPPCTPLLALPPVGTPEATPGPSSSREAGGTPAAGTTPAKRRAHSVASPAFEAIVQAARRVVQGHGSPSTPSGPVGTSAACFVSTPAAAPASSGSSTIATTPARPQAETPPTSSPARAPSPTVSLTAAAPRPPESAGGKLASSVRAQLRLTQMQRKLHVHEMLLEEERAKCDRLEEMNQELRRQLAALTPPTPTTVHSTPPPFPASPPPAARAPPAAGRRPDPALITAPRAWPRPPPPTALPDPVGPPLAVGTPTAALLQLPCATPRMPPPPLETVPSPGSPQSSPRTGGPEPSPESRAPSSRTRCGHRRTPTAQAILDNMHIHQGPEATPPKTNGVLILVPLAPMAGANPPSPPRGTVRSLRSA